MSAQRVLILVAVLVAVLYAVSLAWSGRNQGQPVDPASTSLRHLARSKPIDPAEITALSGRWQTGQWTIDANLGAASLDLAPSRSRAAVRRVKISLQGSDNFRLEYKPRPDPEHAGQTADPNASPFVISRVKPNQPAIELTLREHGGELEVRRLSRIGPAIFRLE